MEVAGWGMSPGSSSLVTGLPGLVARPESRLPSAAATVAAAHELALPEGVGGVTANITCDMRLSGLFWGDHFISAGWDFNSHMT